MTEIEKFNSDLSRAVKHNRNADGTLNQNAFYSYAENLFKRASSVGGCLSTSLFGYWKSEYIDCSINPQNEPTEENINRLSAMLAFLCNSNEYEDCLTDEDWVEMSDMVSAEAEDMPIEQLQDLMSIIVSKGAL